MRAGTRAPAGARGRRVALALALAALPQAADATPTATAADAAPPAAAPGLPSDPVAVARRKADATADLLTATLMARLTGALAEGDPAAAVAVCGDVAQQLTTEVAARDGVRLRRTALRVRNPVNAPSPAERAWLEQSDAALRAGRKVEASYEIVRMPDGRDELLLLRPIVFPGGMCSTCHGGPDEIPASVAATLRERYPNDVATGFRAGDLRGAIAVRVPLPPGS